jgi:DNA adenine methylase
VNEKFPTPARSAVPAAPYLGGKRHLAPRIIDRIGAVPHVTYVEPFVGMGGIFLRRPFRAQAEVINDISGDVANLFRILQRHYVPLMDMLRWQITSRAEFARLCAAVPETLTDLERAVRFLYLQRCAFGGKVRGRNFGVSPTASGRFDVTQLGTILEDVHDRLAGVVIEQLPYGELIARYDHPAALFYLDPPYWGCEQDYGAGVFSAADFAALASILAGIRGKFILSLNDVAEVRRIFAAFSIEAVETVYSISGSATGRGQAAELLISNGGRAGDLFSGG